MTQNEYVLVPNKEKPLFQSAASMCALTGWCSIMLQANIWQIEKGCVFIGH